MATKRAHQDPKRSNSALYSLTSFLVAVGVGALAVGPDSWMEWAMFGVSVISIPVLKMIFAIVAGAILVWLMWPIMTQAASKPR